MVRYHNKNYTQKVCKKEYRAPSEIVNAIYESGAYISSSHGKYMEVFKTVNGKSTYVGSLHDFIKVNSKFRNGNTRMVTLGNLK